MQDRLFALVAVPVLMAALALPALSQSAAQPPEPDASAARSLVHILDYMAQDYPVAVSDGEVISDAEYAEMVGFGENAAALLEELDAAGMLASAGQLHELAERLQASVAKKAAPSVVATQAQVIRNRVIEETGIRTTPVQWPDVAAGQALYQELCTSCHGAGGAGDGPLAPDLEPKPTSFVEGERVASLSPFQAYNTIRMGVDGTAMPAFNQLTSREVWELAFFVKSLQAARQRATTGQDQRAALPDTLAETVSLEQVATLGDADLAAALAAHGIADAEGAVAALRLRTPENGAGGTLGIARRHLAAALASYQSGEASQARRQALQAYLEGVEPAEPSLSARDAVLTRVLEQRMMDVRSAIEEEAGPEAVAGAVRLAQASIADAARVLEEGDRSPWFSFFVAASILLREGLEAFLVILAILSVLRAAGQPEAARWVHGGWMAAVGLGVAAWFFSDLLMQLGAAQREIMEGAVALLAVAVLLYVGFWLHSMTEIEKWKAFIDERVKDTLSSGSLIGLASIAFFAVFREAFESVLFLTALTLEQGPAHKMAVAGGAVVSIALVIALAAVLLRYSVRLPIRTLFKYSSLAMGVLCVILAGKGLHALQEAGVLPITTVPLPVRFDLIGLYPSMETLLAQLATLLVVLLLMYVPGHLAPRFA